MRLVKLTGNVFAVDPAGSLVHEGSWVEDDSTWGEFTTSGDLAAIYSYTDSDAVSLFSIGDPRYPYRLSTLAATAFRPGQEIALGDGYLLGSDWDLRIADLSFLFAPRWASTIDTAEPITSITVNDKYVFAMTPQYLPYTSSKLHVLDLNEPARPAEIAQVPFDVSHIADTTVIKDRLVVVSGVGPGLVTYDVSEPGFPVLETLLNIGSSSQWGDNSLATGSDAVFALWGGNSYDHDVVSVLDFSNPSDPTVVNEIEVDSASQGLATSGDKLMVTTGLGMWLFDVSVDLDPVLLSVSDDIGSWIRAGAVTDTAVYLGDDDGLHVLDISVPNRPIEVGFHRIQGGIRRLVVTPGLLWGRQSFGAHFDGLLIYDISDPLAPVLIGGPTSPRRMIEVFAFGTQTLVAGEFEGLEVFATRCPGPHELPRMPLVVE